MTHPTHGLDPNALEALRNELEGEYGEKVIGKQTLYWLVTACLAAFSQNPGTSKMSGEAVGAKQHKWVVSTLGHGETMCEYCKITNREAAVLGELNECSKAPTRPASPPVGGAPGLDDELRSLATTLEVYGLDYMQARHVIEKVSALASSERSGREAEYVPTIIRNDGAGFYEFVTEDVPALYSGMMAANVERIGTLKGDLIGFRIYDPLEPRASDRARTIEEIEAIIDAKVAEIDGQIPNSPRMRGRIGYAIERLSELRDAIRKLSEVSHV